MKSKFLLACVFQTVKLLQFYGLQTLALVFGGTSANLTAQTKQLRFQEHMGEGPQLNEDTAFLCQISKIHLIHLMWFIGVSVQAIRNM